MLDGRVILVISGRWSDSHWYQFFYIILWRRSFAILSNISYFCLILGRGLFIVPKAVPPLKKKKKNFVLRCQTSIFTPRTPLNLFNPYNFNFPLVILSLFICVSNFLLVSLQLSYFFSRMTPRGRGMAIAAGGLKYFNCSCFISSRNHLTRLDLHENGMVQ
jgi:hypothetical protein